MSELKTRAGSLPQNHDMKTTGVNTSLPRRYSGSGKPKGSCRSCQDLFPEKASVSDAVPSTLRTPDFR